MEFEIDTKGIKKCPKCGSTDRIYIKGRATGIIRMAYNFEGKLDDNAEMYDHISFEPGKYAYCEKCDARLFKMKGGEKC